MFSEKLKGLQAYVPGEQPQDRQYIKLNTNESPYPPSPLIHEALHRFDHERLRLYPDPQAKRLREKLAEVYRVMPDQVFVANGSDEALSFCFYAFFEPTRGKLFFPEFTYSFYPVYCNFYSIPHEKIPLDENYGVHLDGFLQPGSCGIIFANPNAPTGSSLTADRMGSFLALYPADKPVVVDEAYVDFGAETALPLLDKHRNLIVVRTFSKSMSLAGLRLGFVIAHAPMVDALFKVKDSFNSYPVNSLTQLLGEIALSDQPYYRSMRETITRTRERFCAGLRELGWLVLPSAANFVFAAMKGIAGRRIYEVLKGKGILVRHFDIKGIDEFVRITIGKEEDMSMLLDEVRRSF